MYYLSFHYYINETLEINIFILNNKIFTFTTSLNKSLLIIFCLFYNRFISIG